MRRLICVMLIVIIFAGCSKEPTIVGTWEEEITITVLGKTEQEGNHPALLRYTFAQDGSGIREVIPGTIPERTQIDVFTYTLEEDVLTITLTSETQAEVSFVYTINNLTGNVLELYFHGVTNHLTRVK